MAMFKGSPTQLALRALLVAVALVALVLLINDSKAVQSLGTGLGGGAVIAVIALGVTLTYRGSGVINFASGAMAMFFAYVYVLLRTRGELLLPPFKIGVGGSLDTLPALAITIVVAAVFGLLVHFLIYRPMRTASTLAKAVASIGILLTLQAVIVLEVGPSPIPFPPILSSAPQDLGSNITVPRSGLVMTAIVIGATLALYLLYRLTRFGLATRATTENEKGAILLGFSPDLLDSANWVLCGVLLGSVGVLGASLSIQLDPNTLVLLIVPALAAALVGNFTSFSLTFVAAMGIGMAESLVQFLGTKSWFPTSGGAPVPGMAQILPLVVIVAILVVRGARLPSRGSISAIRLPLAPRPRHVPFGLGGFVAVSVVGLLVLGPAWRLGITNSLIGVIIALSFVVLTGFVGQISLAQMALAGVAGFALSRLTVLLGIPFPWGPILGILIAVGAGVLIALPALRVRGVQLAVVTLAGTVAIEAFVFRNPSWSGGFAGAQIPEPTFFGHGFGPNATTSLGDGLVPNPIFGLFCLLVATAMIVAVVNIRRSGTGRRFLAIRANERAAASAGVDLRRTKTLAFAIAAAIAGVGGVLSGYRFGSVSPAYFGAFASLQVLAFAYLGGITSVTGAVLAGLLVTGGLIVTAMNQWTGLAPEYIILIGGIGLILTAVLNPAGIAGAWREMADRRRRKGYAAIIDATATATSPKVGVEGPEGR